MTLNKFYLMIAVAVALVLSACGGNPGADLGDFPAISKIEGDATFTLTAPTSASPGAFSFTSSNPAVAAITANNVSILAVGTTTITATQAASGKWGSASTSAVLTVTARICITPATSQNGVCTAPTMTGNFVAFSALSWMPVSLIKNWADASAFCSTSRINGVNGWRLPNHFELSELQKNIALTNQGWILGKTWSSTAGTTSGSHQTVNLSDDMAGEEADSNSAYVACVK